MKELGKYNLFLLNDDGQAKSFRISRRAVWFFMLIVVFLPLSGAAGMWIGWQAWQDRQLWEQEERLLQQEMTGLRMDLDRLTHIDRLIQLAEAGQLLESGSTLAEAVTSSAPVAVQPPPPPAENGQASAQPGSTPAVAAVPPAETPPQPGETFERDQLAMDSGQVRVDTVSALLSKDRRLRVRLDLHNESGRQIAGTLSYFLLTADETRTPLLHSDAAFRISRLKRFASTITIPDSVGDLTNASLVVEVINSDKDLLFRQFYTITE